MSELRTAYADAAADVDYVRFRRSPSPDRFGQREWFHFVVRAPEVDLVINFSLVEVLRSGRRTLTGQVVLLAREQTGSGAIWDGDVDTVQSDCIHFVPGRISLSMDDAALSFDGQYRVRARSRRGRLAVDLTLTPRCFPYLVHNVGIGAGELIHWIVAPRLHASGVVCLGRREVEVADAPAYHDHNWGRFDGGSLSWEWGCAIEDSQPYSVVIVRLLDRSRTAVLAQGLLLWEGGARRRVFRNDELSWVSAGLMDPTPTLRVPKALSLLASEVATGVPARLDLVARRGGDHLSGGFRARDLSRVLIPRDCDLGTTVIHEVAGRFELRGVIGGRPVIIDEPGFVELVGEAT